MDDDNNVAGPHSINSDNAAAVDTAVDANKNKLVKKYQYFILEPAVLLLFYAWNVSGAVFTNLIVFQSCTVLLGVNESQCLLLGTENESAEIQALEAEVQPYTANILMARSLIESIVPALVSLFIGPWSDVYGRKPVILATFVGYFCTYLLITAITCVSTMWSVSPWYYILAFIPASLSGGNCALITGIFCYITDVTIEQNRAIKMGILEAAIFVGLLLGSLSSSYILNWTNATTVFTIASISILIGILYIVIYIEESVRRSEIEPMTSKVRELFRMELVYDMFQTCVKRRPNFDRIIIWLVMIALGSSIFAMEGGSTVSFLFVREKFEWTVKEYSFYDSTIIISMIAGNLIGMYGIKKMFGLSETVLAGIAFLSYALDSGIKAVAFQPWHLYLAIGVSILKGIAGPMCRAILSNTIPANDIGKVYSLTTSIESITPLASAPLYTMAYKQTLATYPGAFNLISAAIYFLCLVLMIFVYVFQSMYQATTYTSIS